MGKLRLVELAICLEMREGPIFQYFVIISLKEVLILLA